MWQKLLNNNIYLTILAIVILCTTLLLFGVFSDADNSEIIGIEAFNAKVAEHLRDSVFELTSTLKLLLQTDAYKSEKEYYEIKSKLKRYESICGHSIAIQKIIKKLNKHKEYYSTLNKNNEKYQNLVAYA